MKHSSKRLIAASLLLSLFIFCLSFGAVFADAIVKSFNSEATIQPGWVVAIKKDDSNKVELASPKALNRMYGVVVDPNSAALTLQTENEKIYVASSGEYPVLVSTESGNIKSGDYLSMSNTDGIAAKAKDTQDYVIGKALADVNGSTSNLLKTKDGVSVAKINLQINASKNPSVKNDLSVPGPLAKIAGTVAGKQVSVLRIYTSFLVFVVTVAVVGSLIWVGVRTSIISIGRNPLSKHAIIQGLIQVIVAATLVFAGGVAGVYILLKL